MNDEQYPMRQIAHNKSALADLLGWDGKPKPLGFQWALLEQKLEQPTQEQKEAAAKADEPCTLGPDNCHCPECRPEPTPPIPEVGSRWVNGGGGLGGGVATVIGMEGHLVRYVYADGIPRGWAIGGFLKNFTPMPTPPVAPASAPELTPPRFGEIWRRNGDGKEFVCLSKQPLEQGQFRFYDPIEGSEYHQPLDLHRNFTRVTPKPAPQWRPISEWDARDKGRSYIVYKNDICKPIELALEYGYDSHTGDHLARVYYVTHFMAIELPEVPK